MIEFTKPKLGEIRYWSFMNDAKEWWIYKVEITKVGRQWYSLKILKFIDGNLDQYSNGKTQPQVYYWHIQKKLEDAYKMLIYDIFDTRSISLFFRTKPGIEDLI